MLTAMYAGCEVLDNTSASMPGALRAVVTVVPAGIKIPTGLRCSHCPWLPVVIKRCPAILTLSEAITVGIQIS